MYKTKKKSKKLKVFIIVVIIAAVICGAYFYYSPYMFDKYGIKQENKQVNFEISDDNSGDVPYCLYKEGVIKSVNLFKKYMSDHYGTNFTYQNGIYHLNANMSYKQLGEKFQSPDASAKSVTFPEGKNCKEIAKILEENGICSAKDFIKALDDDYDYDFLDEIDNAENRPYKLEGYLYPATYEFVEGVTAHEAVDMMLSAMKLRLEDGILEECKKKNISIDDILTMASIIEKESSGSPAEMSKVSSVFWNRLNNPNAQNTPTLGSDPTVHYANMLEKEGYDESVWKGYSTYSAPGLPTGPICSPSDIAIKAALEPQQSDYYFFFTDKNEKFYYFKTYEQFQKKWKEINK